LGGDTIRFAQAIQIPDTLLLIVLIQWMSCGEMALSTEENCSWFWAETRVIHQLKYVPDPGSDEFG